MWSKKLESARTFEKSNFGKTDQAGQNAPKCPNCAPTGRFAAEKKRVKIAGENRKEPEPLKEAILGEL